MSPGSQGTNVVMFKADCSSALAESRKMESRNIVLKTTRELRKKRMQNRISRAAACYDWVAEGYLVKVLVNVYGWP